MLARASQFAVAVIVTSILAYGLFGQVGEVITVLRIDATPGHEINSFNPDEALGSSIDVLSHRDIDKVYTPHIIQESLSAGWGPITYRNNSELRMAAWHWNENGAWSDPEHRSGYFTGSAELGKPIRYILEYALPHRGFSTSGDAPIQGKLIYWKSNPYLTSKFTGESDSLHPQWVVMDLKAEKPVNAIRIDWASPYARRYQVQYWIGTGALDFDAGPQGQWMTFSAGDIKDAHGGKVTRTLAAEPVSTRFVRVWMTESSNSALTEPGKLVLLLQQFFSYIEPDIEGFEAAVDEFKDRVPELAAGLLEKIRQARKAKKNFIATFYSFLQLCRSSLDPTISEEVVEEMLVQHLLTERLFRTIFDNPEFTQRNAIAREVEQVINALVSSSFSRTEVHSCAYRTQHQSKNTLTYDHRWLGRRPQPSCNLDSPQVQASSTSSEV